MSLLRFHITVLALVKQTTHPGSTGDLGRTVSEKLVLDWELNEVSFASPELYLQAP